MAHTHRLTQTRRALRMAVAAERRRISTAELIERAAEGRERRGISRRQFLQGAAVGSAAVATARIPLPRMMQEATAPRVVIIGAGIAGMAAAYRLQQAGIPSQVIEASNRIGGRMYTKRDFFADGQLCELGGELIDTDHDSLRGLADELGLELIDLHAITGDEEDTYYFDGEIVPIPRIIDEFRPVAQAIIADLDTIGGDGDVLYNQTNGGEALDISITEWLDTRGVTGMIRKLLDVAYTEEYGLEIDQQSAYNLLWLIGTDEGEFSVFGESDERFHVAQGSDAIPNALAAKLETPVMMETRLEAIRQDSAGKYLLTVNQSGSSQDMPADEVVLALPFTLLRQVDMGVELPEVKKRAIAELGYGTNSKLMLGFTSRPWMAAGSTGGVITDLPFQSSWDTSRGQAGDSGLLTTFMGGNAGVNIMNGTEAEQAADIVTQLDQIFPGMAQAYTGQAVRQVWITEPLAQGSYACYRPGQVIGLRGAEGEAVDGLHFAGEHTSLDYQGYMNGGSESGERAAAEIIERLQR